MHGVQKVRRHYWTTGLVTDDSMADQIIGQYETMKAQSDAPVFLHAVTMQNHTNYNKDNYPDDQRVKVTEAPAGLKASTVGALEDFATGIRDAAAMLGKPIEELKLISCHLGNGSSVTAIDGGKSVDTSMGFTPLAGLPMGTRSGDIDAGILEYLMNKYGMDIKEMVNVLNKKSGVMGVSGVSSDFRDLEEAFEQGNERAGLAVDMFNYGVKKLIGAYAAAMGGVDAIIFTAGVGENSASQRMAIASGLEFMGVKMDEDANKVRGEERVISAPDSKVTVLLIPTNEELMIAMDTEALVG